MKNIKKRQHYVWKYYLKAWTKNDQLFCKHNNQVFLSALTNVGQKGFFYESITLSAREHDYIRKFFKNAHPTAEKNLTGLLNLYLITSKADEYTRKCGIEDFHAIVETKAIEILKMLYNLDLSFFEKDDYRNNFSFFVGCQYTRTKKMRDNLIKLPLNISSDISKEKIAKVYSLFFADIIGSWISSRSKIKLIVNDSDKCSFITTDQPIINVKANVGYSVPVQQFELYYPISPKVALYLSESNEGVERVSENIVQEFNRLIFKHSSDQVYALNKSDF